MPGPGLIASYLDALAGQLPGPVVEELADGLEETYRRHLGLGLTPEAAAAAAVTEFGEPDLVAAEFARAHPARRASRRLLVIGPVVGLFWAVALITGRAWAWPVPMAARIVPGVALVAVVALLAVAARGIRYRSVGRAGAAGCVGTAALDAFMIIGVLSADPAARWAAAVAVTASAARLGLNARLLRSALARNGLRGRVSIRQGRDARMIAACMPLATWWVGVMVVPVNPARAVDGGFGSRYCGGQPISAPRLVSACGRTR